MIVVDFRVIFMRNNSAPSVSTLNHNFYALAYVGFIIFNVFIKLTSWKKYF